MALCGDLALELPVDLLLDNRVNEQDVGLEPSVREAKFTDFSVIKLPLI
jgi:hypothetical protein